MNIPVVWEKQAISDNQVRFVSETTFGNSKSATATLSGGRLHWDTDDVPQFVIESAEKHFGIIV